MTQDTLAIIGAGPSGLAAARNFDRQGLSWIGFELADGVGGLWHIDGPRSTMYESAHLISSRTTTEFTEFPMAEGVADYPSHRDLKHYFEDFATHFGLHERFRFNTEVLRIDPVGDGCWDVRSRGPEGERTERFGGVVLANGTLSEPNVPSFDGDFAGDVMHTSAYRSGAQLRDRRVLIVGAGNSGCDIAIDAVHHAVSVDMSVRRGYHFVPKYVFGRPADTLNQRRPLPARVKQAVDRRVLRLFTGDPVRLGFPEPDHLIYESHPIVNSLILHHLGHGDLRVRADVARFDGCTVHFRDGSADDYDLVLLATGYRLHYPFIDPEHLQWSGESGAPDLYLNIFTAQHPTLFVLGMLEASGIGWQGRYEQAELIACYLAARRDRPERAAEVDSAIAGPRPDLSGGYHYLGIDRMSYYVNKDAYRRLVRHTIEDLRR